MLSLKSIAALSVFIVLAFTFEYLYPHNHITSDSPDAVFVLANPDIHTHLIFFIILSFGVGPVLKDMLSYKQENS